MAEKSEDLYVGIHDHLDLRRSVLEASKGAIYLLQRYEHFKELRRKREEEIANLKKLQKEMNALVNKLKDALPKHKFSVPKKKEAPEKKKEPETKVEKKSAAPKPKGELEKLESALSEIEQRLKKID